MIDSHCHLEQKQYENADDVVELCKKELKAVITSCANPEDFGKTIKLTEKYKGFVFACFGLHPEYIKEISEKQKDEYLELVKKNKDKLVGFGEVGLDYKWISENPWQRKQREQFVEMISFSKEIKKPLVVHSRDAGEDTFKILEQEDAKQVLLHFFTYKDLVDRVLENNYNISVNLLVTRNKEVKKIVQKTPLENMMLETDAPWLGPQKSIEELKPEDKVFFKNEKNNLATLVNYPTTIKQTAERIAEIKSLDFEKVWKTCGANANEFFNLSV